VNDRERPWDVIAEFGPAGRLASCLSDYEERPQQAAMAQAVQAALEGAHILVVEAGTGVGKSLAYLAPALAWAAATDERVVVSTNTINLQEQLLRKDIPLVHRALDSAVDVALLKGRSNYLCPRRLEHLAGPGSDAVPDGAEWQCADLATWLETTTDGTRADLPFAPMSALWDEVCSDRDSCSGSRCSYYDDCFYQRSRRQAQAARLVVVNHHLLLADLALRMVSDFDGVVLPPFGRLVVDEAHHLEGVARRHLGSSVGLAGLLRAADEIRGTRTRRGLGSRLQDVGVTSDRLGRWASDVAVAVERVTAAVGIGPTRVTIDEGYVRSRGWVERLEPAVRALRDVVVALAGESSRSAAALERQADDDEAARHLAGDLARTARRLDGAIDALTTFLDVESAVHCRWVDAPAAGRGMPTVRTSPFDVSTTLRDALFADVATTVLTSATLSVGGDFTFTRRSLGLTGPSVRELHLTSPFDFAEQGLLGLPNDLPDPRHGDFTAAVARRVIEAAAVTGGRAFVLFTSYRMLEATFDAAADGLWDIGCTPLKQGDMSRERLLATFCDEHQPVLFGTSSFWEGVDVRGAALVAVIIVKLPFEVPTDPIVAARGAWLRRRGLDPFRDESLPKAVLALKQGVGRLIRSRSDSGVVLVLDKRVTTQRYGRAFLDSLPAFTRCAGPWKAVHRAVAAFAGSRLLV